ncbi:hypothetical protein LABOLPEG_00009 [Pseudomonas phage phi 21A]|nr:hypothetical protein LABOLPEG_00009 [Pseudomonas phage phi 21A]
MSVKDPSTVVTVITQVPSATGVTTPEALTVAMRGSLEVQVTDLFVALVGATVALRLRVAPMATEEFFGDTVTPVTETMLTPL